MIYKRKKTQPDSNAQCGLEHYTAQIDLDFSQKKS